MRARFAIGSSSSDAAELPVERKRKKKFTHLILVQIEVKEIKKKSTENTWDLRAGLTIALQSSSPELLCIGVEEGLESFQIKNDFSARHNFTIEAESR